MQTVEPLEEGDEITADWIASLVEVVNSLVISQGDGSDLIASRSVLGSSLRLSNAARYQMRAGIVETQAPAATVVSGARRAGRGWFRFLDATAVDVTTSPPTIDFNQDAANTVRVPFYNLYTSGSSAAENGLVWLAPSPHGWLLVATEC